MTYRRGGWVRRHADVDCPSGADDLGMTGRLWARPAHGDVTVSAVAAPLPACSSLPRWLAGGHDEVPQPDVTRGILVSGMPEEIERDTARIDRRWLHDEASSAGRRVGQAFWQRHHEVGRSGNLHRREKVRDPDLHPATATHAVEEFVDRRRPVPVMLTTMWSSAR